MINQLELAFGRYNGGQVAPIGSYFNPRTFAIQQFSSDGSLPQDGTWVRVDASGSQTFANIATNINAVLGSSYTSGSFHAQGAGDLIANPGQGSNDA